MFYHKKTNQYIIPGLSFSVDGIQYPANWLNLSTIEDKEALGLEEVSATNARADDRFYYISENLEEAKLTYINTPKDIDTLKTSLIASVNSAAYSILLQTDWYITRFVETGVVVPQEISDYRSSIRQICNNTIQQYNAATNIEELAAVVVNWEQNPT